MMTRFLWRSRRAVRRLTPHAQRAGPVLLAAAALGGFVAHLMAGLPPQLAAYETLRAFLVDAELALTRDVSPGLSRALWAFRFIAPVLAGGALLDFVQRVLPDPPEIPSWVQGHSVIVGAGRLGTRIASRLVKAGLPVVLVDAEGDGDEFRRLRDDEGVFTIVGDARDLEVLGRAGIHRAGRLIAVTGEDDLNLGAGLLAMQRAQPGFEAWAHAADPRYGAAQGAGLHVFSVHDHAAAQFAHRADAHAAACDVLVIAGYGRFGRALHREIAATVHAHAPAAPTAPATSTTTAPATVSTTAPVTAPNTAPATVAAPRRIIVVDAGPVDAASLHAPAEVLRGDLLLESTLEELCALVGDAPTVAAVICTDKDVANLAFALKLRTRLPPPRVRVFMRVFDWPPGCRLTSAELQGIEPIHIWAEAGERVVDEIARHASRTR